MCMARHISDLKRQKRNAGFTLTELAIVLGVIGLLLGGIWVAYAQFAVSNQVRVSAQQLNAIVQNLHADFAEQGVTDTGGTALTQAADQLRVFPLDMRQDPSTPAGVLFNVWSQVTNNGLGTVSIYADNCAGTPTTGTAQACFGVTFLNVPQNACIMLVTQTGQPSMALQEVMINGADVGDANGGTPLPVLASTAATGCNNGGAAGANDIIWIYQAKGGTS